MTGVALACACSDWPIGSADSSVRNLAGFSSLQVGPLLHPFIGAWTV